MIYYTFVTYVFIVRAIVIKLSAITIIQNYIHIYTYILLALGHIFYRLEPLHHCIRHYSCIMINAIIE